MSRGYAVRRAWRHVCKKFYGNTNIPRAFKHVVNTFASVMKIVVIVLAVRNIYLNNDKQIDIVTIGIAILLVAFSAFYFFHWISVTNDAHYSYVESEAERKNFIRRFVETQKISKFFKCVIVMLAAAAPSMLLCSWAMNGGGYLFTLGSWQISLATIISLLLEVGLFVLVAVIISKIIRYEHDPYVQPAEDSAEAENQNSIS